ncbi:MAG TPA: hypothetical protein VF490_12960 [Chryseosolibacter sp.]
MYRIVMTFLPFMLNACSDCSVKLDSIVSIQSVRFKEEYCFDEPSAAGEGFKMIVLSLSEETTKDFVERSDKSTFPLDKDRYAVSYWQRTPITPKWQEAKELVANYFLHSEPAKAYQKQIERALDGQDSFYAFYYRSVVGNIVDIQFFLIDPSVNKMYIVMNKI